jgi:hypothetical protein
MPPSQLQQIYQEDFAQPWHRRMIRTRSRSSHTNPDNSGKKKNYTSFLLKKAAATWGMDNFNEYLKGSKFTLYMDQIMEPNVGNTQLKELNRLKTAMSDHTFDIKNRQRADLPDFLKQKQTNILEKQVDNTLKFNKTIHIDTFWRTKQAVEAIDTITDDSTAYSVSTILNHKNANSMTDTLTTQWFNKYGYPRTIFLKQGKVQASKLEKKINELAPLETTVTCKSQMNTFNTETEQQWKQNRHQILEEEFVNAVNFFHDFRKPELKEKSGGATSRNYNNDDRGLSQVNEDENENNFEEIYHFTSNHPMSLSKRKTIRICRTNYSKEQDATTKARQND